MTATPPGAGRPGSAGGDPDADADPADGRAETETERYDRNWSDLLQELRAVQTGTQILSGFLLAVAFQPRFGDLDPYAHALYLCLVVAAGLATVLGLAPVMLHRALFRKHEKPRLVRTANRLLIAQIAVVSFIAAGVTGLIFDVAAGRTIGVVALVVAALVVIGFWALMASAGRRPRPGA